MMENPDAPIVQQKEKMRKERKQKVTLGGGVGFSKEMLIVILCLV